jgi:hypothetical protein
MQKVKIISCTILRIKMQQDLTVQSELSLVNCSDLDVSVRRNMQPDVFKRIESLNVNAKYKGLMVRLLRVKIL